MCLYLADSYTNEVYHPSFQLHKMIARYVTQMSDELEPKKVVFYGQIGTYVRTRTCIVYHKLCEIYHVFQREYITKLTTHFPV